MGKPRYAARRDNNHGTLIQLATDIGALYVPDGPFDGWVKHRGRWHLIEVKDPKKEGWASEYTDNQVVLMARGIRPDAIWRTEDDVYRLMGVRRTA